MIHCSIIFQSLPEETNFWYVPICSRCPGRNMFLSEEPPNPGISHDFRIKWLLCKGITCVVVAKFKWWRELSPDQRAKHEKLIKIYNVSPFLYSQICQRDNWIRYAHQVGLLPSQRSVSLACRSRRNCLSAKHFAARVS